MLSQKLIISAAQGLMMKSCCQAAMRKIGSSLTSGFGPSAPEAEAANIRGHTSRRRARWSRWNLRGVNSPAGVAVAAVSQGAC